MDSSPLLEPDPLPPEVDEAGISAEALEPDLPHGIADGVLYPLDPRYRKAERLSGRIFVLVVGVIGLGVWSWGWLAGWFTPRVRTVCLGAWPVLLYGLYRLGLLYTELELKHTRFRLTEDFLEIRRGVVWRRIIHVPRSRMQHTDVAQGPIQRKFGIATLTVHTAGTEDASVALSGISHPDALAIRDFLILSSGHVPSNGGDDRQDEDLAAAAPESDEFTIAGADAAEDAPSCDAEPDRVSGEEPA